MNTAKTVFAHLNSNNLVHYIAAGCLRPCFLIEGWESDVQSLFPHHLLVSSQKWSFEADCSLELILNEDEEKSIEKLSNDYALYHGILPISRLRKIALKQKEKADILIWNIENGAGYIPKRLLDSTLFDKTQLANSLPNSKPTFATDPERLRMKYAQFNRLMGGIAFMRTALTDLNDDAINYPVSYAATIAFFNQTIREDLNRLQLPSFTISNSIFNGSASVVHFLAKKVDRQTVLEAAQKEGIDAAVKFGTFDLTTFPSNSLSFRLAVLESYGKNAARTVEDLISQLYPKLLVALREEIGLLFGIYNGYTQLRNHYKLFDRELAVKFKMDTQLDYYIVESLYQFTFNNHKISNTFDYLKDLFPPSSYRVLPSNYQTYQLLGCSFITKPLDYSEHFERMLQVLTNALPDQSPNELTSYNKEAFHALFAKHLKPEFDALVRKVKKDALQLSEEASMAREDSPVTSVPEKVKSKPPPKPYSNKKHVKKFKTAEDILNAHLLSKEQLMNWSNRDLQELCRTNMVSFVKKDTKEVLVDKYLARNKSGKLNL